MHCCSTFPMLFVTSDSCFFKIERAFKYWETGELVLPSKKARKFSKKLWGFATGEVTRAAGHFTEKQWDKLKALAMDNMGDMMERGEEVYCEKAKVSTGRAHCVEEDSD